MDFETVKGKVLGLRGGYQPRKILQVKEGHLAVTATCPAVGPACTPLFTFSGVRNDKDMMEGCGSEARWNKTPNGWPDYSTMMTWAHMMVAHKAKRGHEKMIIFCDNAGVHMNQELNHLFSLHNIRLFGLIPSSTHATQPLDLVFFGLIKPMMESFSQKDKAVLAYCNAAKYWLMAQKELERRVKQRAGPPQSLLSDGFRAAGIYPLDPSRSFAKTTYSTAVYKPSAAEVAAAKEVGKRAGQLEAAEIEASVQDALMNRTTGATLLFAPLSEAGIKEREMLAGKKKKAFAEPRTTAERAVYFQETHSFTSESFAKAATAKAAALAAEEVQKKAKAAATAAKKVADAAAAAAAAVVKAATDAEKLAKRKAEEQAKLDRAAIRAAKAAAAAAKLAAKGVPKPKAPPKVGGGKRGREEGGDLWKPQVKRVRGK
jgi:hypothetical protein